MACGGVRGKLQSRLWREATFGMDTLALIISLTPDLNLAHVRARVRAAEFDLNHIMILLNQTLLLYTLVYSRIIT